MKVGDLVTDDRSHMEKTNWFYNSWLRTGIILHIGTIGQNNSWAEVMWADSQITHEPVSNLEVISESW